ncbi:MAG TPA: hypothetical protein VEW65_08175, partial [Chryseolinea sp.]|nr:hypothetical protein [Chryseolinea sp.]
MKTKIFLCSVMVICLTSCTQTPRPAESATTEPVAGELDRSSLPIKEPIRQTYNELDARNAKAPERFAV